MGRCRNGHQVRPGHRCVECRRTDTLAAIITAELSLDTETVTAVFNRVVTNGAALRSLAEALATDPHILSVGAPPVVGRLVTELVAAGSTTFTVPTCGRCGRSDRPLFRSDQDGAACARCRSWQRAAPCAFCGATKPVAAHTETGNPMCELCRRRRRGQRTCGMCGETAPIAVRGRDDRPDVCVNCYLNRPGFLGGFYVWKRGCVHE